MSIFSIIALISLILSIVSIIFALKGKPLLYWMATVGIYIFSFITGFSIGQITIGFTFVFLALAVGSSINLIKNKFHLTFCGGIGFLVGVLVVAFVDDYWIFLTI